MQTQLAKTLNKDFSINCRGLFYVTDDLVDEIIQLFGDDLEFLRPILKYYTNRNKPQIAGNERLCSSSPLTGQPKGSKTKIKVIGNILGLSSVGKRADPHKPR
jgi:hypothetical protein